MTGMELAIGPCFACGVTFSFDPDTVPAIPVDPVTLMPPDIGGTDPARAVNRPLCDVCLPGINQIRAEVGLPPFTHLHRPAG